MCLIFDNVFCLSCVCKGNDAWRRVLCVATDGGSSFNWVMQNMLPGVPHLLCLYHIHMNLRKQLASKLGKTYTAFTTQFFKCAYQVRNEAEFETCWASMLQTYPNATSYLTAQLYPCRAKWSSAWTLQYCTFGAKSTQRVESINRVVKHFVPAGAPVEDLFKELIEIFDVQSRRRQQRLADDEFANHKYNGALYRDAVRILTKQAAERLHEEGCESANYSVTYHPTRPSADCNADALSTSCSSTAHASATCLVCTSDGYSTTSIGGYAVRPRGVAGTRWHWVTLTETSATCSDCDFAQNILLPCRHILAANLVRWPDAPPFRVAQCHSRWEKDVPNEAKAGDYIDRPPALLSSISAGATSSSSPAMEDVLIGVSQDALFNQYIAVAVRLGEFLKPHGEPAFKEVKDWMEQRIKRLSVGQGSQVRQHMNITHCLCNILKHITTCSRTLFAISI